MSRELTESQVDRQNILNNTYALKKTEELLPLGGYFWRKTEWLSDCRRCGDIDFLFYVFVCREKRRFLVAVEQMDLVYYSGNSYRRCEWFVR